MWIKTQLGELVNLSKATEIKCTFYKPVEKYAIEAFADNANKKKKYRLEVLAMFTFFEDAQEYLNKLDEKLGAEEIGVMSEEFLKAVEEDLQSELS